MPQCSMELLKSHVGHKTGQRTGVRVRAKDESWNLIDTTCRSMLCKHLTSYAGFQNIRWCLLDLLWNSNAENCFGPTRSMQVQGAMLEQACQYLCTCLFAYRVKCLSEIVKSTYLWMACFALMLEWKPVLTHCYVELLLSHPLDSNAPCCVSALELLKDHASKALGFFEAFNKSVCRCTFFRGANQSEVDDNILNCSCQ